MSDTPRTDAVWEKFRVGDLSQLDPDVEFSTLARDLERELNAAQAAIRQQELLIEENLGLKERIKRLEEAGNLSLDFSFRGMHVMAEQNWRKAKEAKP